MNDNNPLIECLLRGAPLKELRRILAETPGIANSRDAQGPPTAKGPKTLFFFDSSSFFSPTFLNFFGDVVHRL
jgi:hypothetical protein